MQRVGGASGAFVSDLDAARQADAVRLGFAHAPDPGLEHEAVHDGGTARPLRGEGDVQDQGLSASDRSGRRTHAPREPGRGRCRRPGARGSAASLADTACPSTPLGRLAGQVRKAGIKRVTGKVLADASIFDRRRGIPTSGVDASGELGPLSGLSYDSGIVHGHYAKNPELVAARALRHKLRATGVHVGKGTGRANLPARALRRAPLGSVSSPTVANAPRRHAQALEQLLRRDAAEAPRRISRGRQGDDAAGHTEGEEVRPPRGSPGVDGERVRPLAGGSGVAPRGRPAADRDGPSARRRGLPALAAPGRRAGDRRGPHERHRGGRELPDQDRDPDRRQRAVGLLRCRPWCRGLLDPDELGERGRGAPRPGSDGGADRPLQDAKKRVRPAARP